MNFNSQICTTREQSERLLAFGLKPETADMYLEKCRLPEAGEYYIHALTKDVNPEQWFSVRMNRDIIPAWSLNRLLEIMPEVIYMDDIEDYWLTIYGKIISYTYFLNGKHMGDLAFINYQGNVFEGVISMIEWLIAKGYFNSDYYLKGEPR